MKHCKLIVLCISSIAIVICAVMIIRINVLYPNAEVISYTKDNPVDINGLEVKPIDYSVYTLDEFSEISSETGILKERIKIRSGLLYLHYQ